MVKTDTTVICTFQVLVLLQAISSLFLLIYLFCVEWPSYEHLIVNETGSLPECNLK